MSRRQSLGLVLSLLRASVERDPQSCSPHPDAAVADWEAVVALASAHLVLPALSPVASAAGAPRDAAEFLAAIHRANGERNADLLRALLQLTHSLNSRGIEPVVLKGGCFLVAEHGRGEPPAPWRFLSDLDLLIGERELPGAVEVARDLGYRSPRSGYDRERDAHYPGLESPCGRFALELHTRLFARSELPAFDRRLSARAAAISNDGARLHLPTPADRIAHLIAHAQLHHRHFALRRLQLRGFLELSHLLGRAAARGLWGEALAPFAEAGQRRAATAYIAAWRRIMDARADEVFLSRDDHRWAAAAVRQLAWPARLRILTESLRATRDEAARALGDSDVLQRHLRVLVSPRQLAERLLRHRERLRQAHWA